MQTTPKLRLERPFKVAFKGELESSLGIAIEITLWGERDGKRKRKRKGKRKGSEWC
jgi:hypothetical protein